MRCILMGIYNAVSGLKVVFFRWDALVLDASVPPGCSVQPGSHKRIKAHLAEETVLVPLHWVVERRTLSVQQRVSDEDCR